MCVPCGFPEYRNLWFGLVRLRHSSKDNTASTTKLDWDNNTETNRCIGTPEESMKGIFGGGVEPHFTYLVSFFPGYDFTNSGPYPHKFPSNVSFINRLTLMPCLGPYILDRSGWSISLLAWSNRLLPYHRPRRLPEPRMKWKVRKTEESRDNEWYFSTRKRGERKSFPICLELIGIIVLPTPRRLALFWCVSASFIRVMDGRGCSLPYSLFSLPRRK